jgi:hypothetical protein
MVDFHLRVYRVSDPEKRQKEEKRPEKRVEISRNQPKSAKNCKKWYREISKFKPPVKIRNSELKFPIHAAEHLIHRPRQLDGTSPPVPSSTPRMLHVSRQDESSARRRNTVYRSSRRHPLIDESILHRRSWEPILRF